ncbi:DUF1403 family protein [Mesorhizobium sp. M5C.F.Cr.IN.023.01.1.1]|nr:DUF1403 family protein [Mesorhizobium sp. M5C.F.Cr.IN.023.01.1.1]
MIVTSAGPATSAAAVPGWLRAAAAAPQSLEDATFAAAAALTALDAVVRRQERWAGAWRQRLALGCAAATVRQAGRVEDESALRDAVLLARPGDFLSVGPAGRMLLAWRRLAGSPAEKLLTEASVTAVLDDLGLARGDEAVLGDLVEALRQLAACAGTVGMLTGAVAACERRGLPRAVASWLADALLAQRLGWAHAVPLLGAEPAWGASAARRGRPAAGVAAPAVESESDRAKNLLGAEARAALRAIDLFTDLERRAQKLLAVAPKLRAKGAELVVENLLSDDALVASRGDRGKKTGMSDRGLRRLFDRLVGLGAVRELSGRATFRIYGL